MRNKRFMLRTYIVRSTYSDLEAREWQLRSTGMQLHAECNAGFTVDEWTKVLTTADDTLEVEVPAQGTFAAVEATLVRSGFEIVDWKDVFEPDHALSK